MADYAQIEVELRSVKYTTEATDSAGILFLSILFNEDETQLIRQGRMEDAVAMYSDRAASRMKHKLEAAKTPEEKQKVEDYLNNEIMLELWQRMERSNSVRSLIAKRIKELFRFAEPNSIPERLVFWNSEEDNGINLSASDLLTLFSAIVGPTLADLKKNKPRNEAAPTTVIAPEPAVAQNPTVVETLAPVTADSKASKERSADRDDSLREQRAAIEKLLKSNPEPDMRKVLGNQLANIDAQLVG